MKLGYLKLPVLELEIEAPKLGEYDEFYGAFRKLISACPAVIDKGRQLSSDTRIAALEGKEISSGSASCKFHNSHLLAWWAWRANLHGTARADADLEDYLAIDEIDCYYETWLTGLRLRNSIDLFDGAKLVPAKEAPESSEKFSVLNGSQPGYPFQPTGENAESAVIVSEFKAPKFWSKDQTRPFEKSFHLQVGFLINVLPHLVCLPRISASRTQLHCPLGPFGGERMEREFHEVEVYTKNCIDSLDVERLRQLNIGLNSSSPKKQNRIMRALKRLATAKGRCDIHDRALDLGIALEMLLLDDLNDPGGLPGQWHVQFRLRGAWLVGHDYESRLNCYKMLGEIYSGRSQVAHDGALRNVSDRYVARFNEQLRLAETIFFEFITTDRANDWSKLLLGAGQPFDSVDAN